MVGDASEIECGCCSVSFTYISVRFVAGDRYVSKG